MKTIGLLGGMSWESTGLYYQHINQMIQMHLGQLHSAKIILISVDFSEIERLQAQGLWHDAGEYLAAQAVILEQSGAECIVLCTNTMHKVAAQIQNSIQVPLIHIADATAKQITACNIKKIALLGTAFTMEQEFYKNRLVQQGLEVVVPNAKSRALIHQVIYNELCLGIINQDSQQKYIDIIEDLIASGIEGVILGCTEICMLLEGVHFSVPLFDTTKIHAQAAVHFAVH